MGFRTVVIKQRCKLDVKLNYLVCRGEGEIRVFIPEINTLIIESTAVALTAALLCELTRNGTKVVFCDEKHNPQNELVAYYPHTSSVKRIRQQVQWKDETKQKVWQKIIKEKISRQRMLLAKLDMTKEANLLASYIPDVHLNDATNREGFAAKVYFNCLFGLPLARRSVSFLNGALNYGYAIILACFNREIAKYGYLTQLGIWHKNEFNYFNLSSDLMEPFRILVDEIAVELSADDKNFKMQMLEVLNKKVKIAGKEQVLENAISVYCKSVFDALNHDDVEMIEFYE